MLSEVESLGCSGRQPGFWGNCTGLLRKGSKFRGLVITVMSIRRFFELSFWKVEVRRGVASRLEKVVGSSLCIKGIILISPYALSIKMIMFSYGLCL